jgi:hypothetical protein
MATNYEKLLENIEKSEKGLSTPGFNMNDYLLPEIEIVKNLILVRNPGMSKGDINLMVDGLESTGEKSKSIEDLDRLKDQGDTDFKKKQISDSVNDTKMNLSKGGIPIPKTDFLYQEAKDLKRIMIEKTYEFVRKIQELIKDIAFAAISLVQAIPGSLQLIISPVFPVPAFNIPGMITMLMNIILTLNSLKSKCADVKGIFVYFSKLNLVCSPSDADKVAGILNNFNETLDNTICSFTNKIDAFTGSASKVIKSTLDPTEEGKRIRTITRQLRRMDYLPDNNFNKVDEDDEDGVRSILEEWEVIDRMNRTKAVRRKKSSQDAINSTLSSIESLDSINNDIKELTSIKEPVSKFNETIVYDVELPDGTIIKGLTKDEVDGYAAIYNVIYSPNVKFIDNPLPNKFSLRN